MQAIYRSQPNITLDAALRGLQAAIRCAESLGIRICAAVVDGSGQPVGFLRMPGAFLVASELCQKKARTAVGFGLEPEILEEALTQEATRVREGLLLLADFTLIRGGRPIRADGNLIGAIGVSGGSEEEDALCAEAGLAAIYTDVPSINPA